MALVKNMLYGPQNFLDEPKPSGEQCLRALSVFLPLLYSTLNCKQYWTLYWTLYC